MTALSPIPGASAFVPLGEDEVGNRLLAQLSHFAGFAAAKPFRISAGYPKVFTTGEGAAVYFAATWEALIRGGGWEGSVIRI